jgi:filamentous hemagglutinin
LIHNTNCPPDPIFSNHGSQIPQNGKFYNIYKSDPPNPVERYELTNINNEWMVNVNGNMQIPREGAYTFVTLDGKIYIGDGRDPYHIDLSGGSPVD